jgi:putative transposase
VRKPFPDWVEDRPKPIWTYATTHFTRAGMAVTATGDLVSRKVALRARLGRETATQAQVVFTHALQREGSCRSSSPP